MKLSDCGLWIDASLILNFKRPAAESYKHVGVDHQLVEQFAHDSPWPYWLLGPVGQTLDGVQSSRDSYLSTMMAREKVKVSHRSGFDLAKLFEEAGGKVAITSHESLEALEMFTRYCGLEKAELFPLRSKALAHESFEKWNRGGQKFTYVIERGVHLGAERKIVEQLADKGIMLNVKSYLDLRTTVRGALHVISDKGFKNV